MSTFDHFLKSELNEPQREAVTQSKGAMIVIAGAGSGKTRVITARMAHLILNENVDPYSIIALTFTNKAAGEMKERLFGFLGSTGIPLPFVGTFHAYCLLLLRSNPTLLPFTNFSILDEDDQQALLKKIIKKNNLEKQISSRQLSYTISNMKNKITSDDDEIFLNPIYKELYYAYETEKAESRAFDFDDLLLVILNIFQKNKEFKAKFQSRIRHVLVDEYQDTSGVQHQLLKEIGLDNENKFVLESLCAVGDEDQSIYSWRGALVTNMLSFRDDFSPVTTIKIEQNYRSVQPILQAANHVIENNKQRHPKELWSKKEAKNRILAMTCQSAYGEAETIASYLKIRPKKVNLRDVAILYRTHFQSRNIEEALIRNSIPYVIIGGIRFYERKEIRDLLAYLRLIINPFDRTSLFRIINQPSRGLGEKFEELLYLEWSNNPLFNFQQILQHLIDTPEYKLGNVKAAAIKKFLLIFQDISTKTPKDILGQIIERTDYLNFLKDTYDPSEAETKTENIEEFVRSIEKYDNLETFLYEIALLQEQLQKDAEHSDHVQMMTLHAAKGLEFDTVIIAGLEEGLLPSSKSLGSDDALEEERRLFYVGMTRAKERLILVRCLCRNSYGQILDQVASRFLREVPSTLIHHINLTEVHTSKIEPLIAEWLGSKVERTITLFQHPTPPPAPKKVVSWRKNQTVIHEKFGTGIIKKVEPAQNDQFYLTVFFKSGEKKIMSHFVRSI